jgi:hypothetical protein
MRRCWPTGSGTAWPTEERTEDVQGSRGCFFAAAALLAGWLPHALAQQSIYTCVDGKGRRLTADRPILECIDREQQELNPNGTVKRRLMPSMTPEERAAAEEKTRLAQEERNRVAEEKKRQRALVARYPDKAAHDKERQAALRQSDEVLASANRRAESLQADKRKLDAELEFYKTNPSRMPQTLKRRVEENDQQIGEQQRFIANQHGEKARINARFDEELGQLRKLWSQPVTAHPASAAASHPARKTANR